MVTVSFTVDHDTAVLLIATRELLEFFDGKRDIDHLNCRAIDSYPDIVSRLLSKRSAILKEAETYDRRAIDEIERLVPDLPAYRKD